MKRPALNRKTAEDRRREKIAALQASNAAQQAELDDLRAYVAQLTAPKPGRAFRTRKLILGPLDITIKGTDVTESEVVIEQIGGYLGVRVGDAIGGMASSPALQAAAMTTRQYDPASDSSPPRGVAAAVAPTYDLQGAELRSVGLQSVAALRPGIEEAVFTDDGRLVQNASLGPQVNPRVPTSQQQRSEAAVIAQRDYQGWDGRGPKPAGWVDPDLPTADPPSN